MKHPELSGRIRTKETDRWSALPSSQQPLIGVPSLAGDSAGAGLEALADSLYQALSSQKLQAMLAIAIGRGGPGAERIRLLLARREINIPISDEPHY